MFPFGNMEEVGRQNMAMMERAFSLFTPFYRGGTRGQDEAGAGAGDRRAARRGGEPAPATGGRRRPEAGPK